MSIVALIPARAGSKRIPRKNVKDFCGHPLIAYTIAAAQQSAIFDRIAVCTDCDRARIHCAVFPDVDVVHRIESGDSEPDIDWVSAAMANRPELRSQAFAILRPTSPFRTADTIRRAWAEFKRNEVHSLRAVESATQHPYKMWTWQGPGYPMSPLIRGTNEYQGGAIVPWHSCPTQSLQRVYVQNASLEIAWTYVLDQGTISGTKVLPFFTEGYEGLDINTPDDWDRAEALVRDGRVTLPFVGPPPPAPPIARPDSDRPVLWGSRL